MRFLLFASDRSMGDIRQLLTISTTCSTRMNEMRRSHNTASFKPYTLRIECFQVTSRRRCWCSINKRIAAMLVSPINPLGIELYSYADLLYCFTLKTCSLIALSERKLYSNSV